MTAGGGSERRLRGARSINGFHDTKSLHAFRLRIDIGLKTPAAHRPVLSPSVTRSLVRSLNCGRSAARNGSGRQTSIAESPMRAVIEPVHNPLAEASPTAAQQRRDR